MCETKSAQYTKVSSKENGPDEMPNSYGFGFRHIQLLLTTMALATIFLARSHIGVTVVAMTSKSHSNHLKNNQTNIPINISNLTIKDDNTTVWEDVDYDNTTKFEDDEVVFILEDSKNAELQRNLTVFEDKRENSIMTYDWPKSRQEMILGSFFLGYSIMMFPMGLLVQRWGGKLPIQIALLVNGLISILTPWLTTWGSWKAMCACRVLQGLSQAGFMPAVQSMIANWSSIHERGRFLTYVYTGTVLGTIIAFQLAGFIAASSWGWPLTFWVVGGICLSMLVVMSVFGSARPSEHKGISSQEKIYIMGRAERVAKKKLRVPWKAILTSKHVWAANATHVGSGLCFIFFFNQGPTYIHHILDVDIKKSGLLSSLPYISNIIVNLLFGFLSDFLTTRNILSLTNARKVFNSFSQIGIAMSYVAVSYTRNIELAVTCLVLAMSFHTGTHCGWMVNHIDLAPNYAGTLMALGNVLMISISLVIPVLISYIVTDVTNQFQWRIMFFLMASLAFFTNAIYVFFMTSDTQPWNDYCYEETDAEDTPEIEKE